jgi:hypothetical protein
MIRQKNIVPGKLLKRTMHVSTFDANTNKYTTHNVVEACLIIGFSAKINRRHSKKTKEPEGWSIFVLWLGDLMWPLETVWIRNDPVKYRGVSWSVL